MTYTKLKLAALGLIATVGLSACTDGYGYSGVSVGYGAGGYGDYYDAGYGGGYGGGYGYGGGFGTGYYGWYNDFYYPGTGYYVYGRDRQRYRWNDGQRRYWEARRGDNRGRNQTNWQGFNNDGRSGRNARQAFQNQYRAQGDRQALQGQYRAQGDRQAYVQGQANRQQYRGAAGVDRPAYQRPSGADGQRVRTDGGNRGGRQRGGRVPRN